MSADKVGSAIHLVVVDLGAKKDTVEILRSLSTGYPFARTEAEAGLHLEESRRLLLRAPIDTCRVKGVPVASRRSRRGTGEV